jgi:hypothetical protein
MGTITVKVSDLTGKIIEEEQIGRLVVEQHPDFEGPIALEVLPSEIEGRLPQDSAYVALAYFPPSGDQERRVLMPLDEFNSLFKDSDPETVLEKAIANQQEETKSRRGRKATSTKERVDYASPEHAGEPHRGVISEAEREYVREHLEEVNTRLREKGMREIDPNDPKMAERYELSHVE